MKNLKSMWVKRSIDIVVAVVVLVILSPVLLVTSLLIKLSSPGPVLFRQTRVGIDGSTFAMFKFRSMTVGVDPTSLATSEDPRITPVGKWIRRAAIDELPQLLNVLRGEMSIIGPRPALVEMVPFYNDQERLRLKAKPGLTGWAQVNGRNALPYHERLKLDTWYVEHWSIWLDMLIFVKTIPAMTNRGGLYQEDARPWEKRPEAGGE